MRVNPKYNLSHHGGMPKPIPEELLWDGVNPEYVGDKSVTTFRIKTLRDLRIKNEPNKEGLFICPECKKVYGLYKYRGKKVINYYSNLPKYGKPKRMCHECK